jgi:proteasome lid subunit RPN8/RPN11
MGQKDMTKIRWHKRPETKGTEEQTTRDVSVLPLEDQSQYQSFAHNNVQLLVIESAIHQLKTHLSQDTTKETGGILVGNVSVDSEKSIYHTKITGAIAAPTTIGTRSTFRFTSHCWTAILKEQKERYPQTQIVGWYHSHPNFGVFLSGVDLDTQGVYFNQPWHIAVVYDPIRDEIGFFCGAKGEEMNSVKTLQPQELEFESFQDMDEHSENHLVEDEQLEPNTVDDSTNTKPVSSSENSAPGFLSIFTNFFKLFRRS